jgi:ribosomal protein L37AE/L43A
MRKREHMTLNTVSTALWCNKCSKETQHSVSGRKIGHCLECSARAAGTIAPAPVKTEDSGWPVACTCSAYSFPHHHVRARY